MTGKTIRGAVNVALLDKADRLFRNNDEGVWIEVLQNARRACATTIAVSIEEVSPDGDSCTVTVEDNGRGITDFQTLVTLGRSGWPEETEAAEDPAGMGFFSLCHSDVEVRSGKKYVRISRAVFLGKADADIEEREEFVPDTRLRFQPSSTRRALVAAPERVTEFCRWRYVSKATSSHVMIFWKAHSIASASMASRLDLRRISLSEVTDTMTSIGTSMAHACGMRRWESKVS